MRILMTVFGVALMCFALTACGGDDAAVDESTETVEAPPALKAVTKEKPEPVPIPVPGGFPKSFPILEGLEITFAQVLDADKGMYKVVGASTLTIAEVLEHYEAVFTEGGWAEDMSMDNEGMTIISAIKDGLLVTVESHEGGLGSVVSITTGYL